MKEELTREVLESMRQCLNYEACGECPVDGICPGIYMATPKLSTALLEEMDKPKVWYGAPENAHTAMVVWYGEDGSTTHSQDFTREIPKTRARQIAEKEGRGLAEKYGWNAAAKELVTNVMESALEKYAAELKGKE